MNKNQGRRDSNLSSAQRREFMKSAAVLGTLAGFPLIAACADEAKPSDLLVKRDPSKPRIPPGQTPARIQPSNVAGGEQPQVAPQPEVSPDADAAQTDDVEADPLKPSEAESTPEAAQPEGTLNDPFYYDARKRDASGQLASLEERSPPGQKKPQPELTNMLPAPARGDSSRDRFRLKVHGEVESPFELNFFELLKLPQTEVVCDIHCVTTWSVLDVTWLGVTIKHLADKAGVKSSAKHVIFEAQHGYTANVPLDEALLPNCLVAHRLQGSALPAANGGPVRNLIPDLYFWKSAKWLTGIRFVEKDEPGYWEVRGYHNHADPWKEERYSWQEPDGFRNW